MPNRICKVGTPIRTFSTPQRLLPLAALSILLAGGGAQSAQADYIVKTDAQTAFSNTYTAVGDYNILATGSTFSTANGGVAVASSSGTIDLTGLFTSSFDQASISYSSTGLPSGLQTGSAYAAANLADGTLKAANVNSSIGSITSDSTAAFKDVLHYSLAGGTTDIPVQFVLSGIPNGQNGSTGLVMWSMAFGAAGLNTDIAIDPGTCAANYPTACIVSQNFAGWVPGSTSFTSDTVGSIIFNGLYQVQGTSADIAVNGSLFIANGGTGGNASSSFDYSHTADFILPQTPGVSYTSDSGVFLTAAAPSAVPEPASIVLLGFSLVALGFTRRRLQR